jgi:hypothetical protein
MGDRKEQARYDREKFLGPIRRASDFVKCLDPKCEVHQKWQTRSTGPLDHIPHCHPVF